MELEEQQLERYSRNILLKEVGVTGQQKLLNARVLIVGAGGLGSPAAVYLAAAGVGTIGIVDSDVVELNNLQRQIIHSTEDVGRDKAISAQEKVKAINPDVKTIAMKKRLRAENIADVVADYDFIIDGSDNFPTKFLVNDACYFQGKPFSHAGILRFMGQTMTYTPGAACYRCVFRSPPPPGSIPTCQEAGILGAVAGILGSIQAAETLRYIVGIGELLTNRLLVMDASDMDFRTINIKRDPECPLCGEEATITRLVDYEGAECRMEPPD